MVDAAIRERHVLDLLQQRYEQLGYSFIRYPAPDLVPFLEGFAPDALAISDSEKVVIEVKTKRDGPARPLAKVADAIRKRQGWRLDLFVADEQPVATIGASQPEKVRAEISEARQLLRHGHARAAFVLAWGALEAAARGFEPGGEHHPIAAQSLVEFLEREGLVPSDLAERLSRLVPVRDGAVHGELERPVEDAAVESVLGAAESTLAAWQAEGSDAS